MNMENLKRFARPTTIYGTVTIGSGYLISLVVRAVVALEGINVKLSVLPQEHEKIKSRQVSIINKVDQLKGVPTAVATLKTGQEVIKTILQERKKFSVLSSPFE